MFNLYELIKPVDIEERLERYGKRPHDGGYVLSPSELSKTNIVYSYGVGYFLRDIHFDFHMNDLGKTVYLYDGSIDSLDALQEREDLDTKDIDNFIFKSEYINSENIIKELELNNHIDQKNLTAVMDVEGSEYEIFSKCDEIYFNTFSQIALEFHKLHEPTKVKESALKRLNDKYYIYHIHANNYGKVKSGYPDTLEVSYIRKDSLDFKPKNRLAGYPIKNLDVKNRPRRPDVPRFNWWT
jgi:hypothetical protein